MPKRPGLMRLWAFQALAHGSDGVMFFQWRAARAARREVPQRDASPRWDGGARLERDGPARQRARCDSRRSPGRRRVPMSRSSSAGTTGGRSTAPTTPRSSSTCRRSSAPGTGPSSTEASRSTSFRPAGELDGYRLVVAPNLYLLTDEALETVTAFVRAGGVFVCGYFSGIVDENDHVRSPEQTAALRRLLGVRVDEFWPIPPGEEVGVELSSGGSAIARDWSEWLELDGGDAIASYTSGVLAGRPAVIRNAVDAGVAYYCSAGLDAAGLASIVAAACADANVSAGRGRARGRRGLPPLLGKRVVPLPAEPHRARGRGRASADRRPHARCEPAGAARSGHRPRAVDAGYRRPSSRSRYSSPVISPRA